MEALAAWSVFALFLFEFGGLCCGVYVFVCAVNQRKRSFSERIWKWGSSFLILAFLLYFLGLGGEMGAATLTKMANVLWHIAVLLWIVVAFVCHKEGAALE